MTVERNPSETESESGFDAAELAEAVQAACKEGQAESGDQDSDIARQLAEQKDRVLRLQAEMENLRSRTSREIMDERRYGPLPVLRDLLPVVDNIDRAIEAAEQSDEAASLLEGFRLVRQQLATTLEQHHCRRIEAVGEPFDPQFHEAIQQMPSDETPVDHVSLETQTGYVLHDRVVRPSQVIVSSGPADSKQSE